MFNTQVPNMKVGATTLFLLVIFNFLASILLSDFWQSPLPFVSELTIYGREFLASAVVFLLTGLIAFVIQRVTGWSTSKLIYFICFLPCIAFIIANWAFFDLFDRFAGLYGVQTVVYDGGRVLGIGSDMGDTQSSLRNIAILSIPFLVTGFLVVFTSHVVGRYIQLLMSSAFLSLSLIFFVLIGIPGIESSVASRSNKTNDAGINRIVSTQKRQLSVKSGPFSLLVRETADFVFSSFNTDIAVLNAMQLQPVAEKNKATVKAVSNPPNIIFIMVESMRPDVLSQYGADQVIMPTVDSLAKEGIVFSNVWAQSSHSNYADIAALSGQYPLRSQSIHFYPKHPSYPRSLPWEHLAQYDYQSAGFSSGDDNWGRMLNYLKTENLDLYDHAGDSVDVPTGDDSSPIEVERLDDGKNRVDFTGFMVDGSRSYGKSRFDEETTSNAISWINHRQSDKPFFLYLNFQASHAPYTNMPSDFERRFLTEEGIEAEKIRSGELLDKPIDLIEKSYFDALSYVDQNISLLVDFVNSNYENTIFIITADTGTEFGAQLIGNGGRLVKDVLRIPLVVSGPSIEQAFVHDVPMAQIDILPTVYGLTGLGTDLASQGEDVLASPDPNRFIFSLAQSPAAHQYSIIHKDWQLLIDNDRKTINSYYVGLPESQRYSEIPPQLRHTMAVKLDSWVAAQLGYYSSSSIHKAYYPPPYREIVKDQSSQGDCQEQDCTLALDE